jgi:phage protein D
MAEPALEQPRDAPHFKVLVGGSELPVETAADILEVKVSDYVEGASTFTVTFNNWNSETQEFKWIDQDILSEGTEVEVKVGYVDDLNSIIKGEVTALEPEFPDNEAPSLKIQGYDRLHRFRRGRKTRSFVQMKDSDIAGQIASELGLTAQADDTSVTHDYVLQSNQTDIDFLLERARRIHFEVTVKDKTLNFRKAANDQSKVVSLQYGLTLQSFYPRLSTMRQVGEVVVKGWNALTKEIIVAKSQRGDEISKMKGEKLGVVISTGAFQASEKVIVDKPIFSMGEAQQMAKGKFNEMSNEFITGEGTAIGNMDIRAGAVVELEKLGKRFSGLYYITSSTHTVGPRGYNTKFTVARNAT